MSVSSSLAEKWRAYCLAHPRRFLPIVATTTVCQHFEKQEEAWINEVVCLELEQAERAVALRRIIELRRCTARDAASFFGCEPTVIIGALSLMAATNQAAQVAAMVTPAERQVRAKAA